MQSAILWQRINNGRSGSGQCWLFLSLIKTLQFKRDTAEQTGHLSLVAVVIYRQRQSNKMCALLAGL